MTYWQAKDEGREYGPFATLLEAMQSMQADDGTPELNEARRAQLGPDEEKRLYRPQERCLGRGPALANRSPRSVLAHRTDGLDMLRSGVGQPRRGWLEKKDVLNARPLTELRRLIAPAERAAA
jgi:hypothetical protein